MEKSQMARVLVVRVPLQLRKASRLEVANALKWQPLMALRASSKNGYNLGSLRMYSGVGLPTLGGLMKLVYSGGDEKMTSIFRKYV